MRETVLLKNLRVPSKNVLLDANPDTGASIHIHGNVEIDANLDSERDDEHPFPPVEDIRPYIHKDESILTNIEDYNDEFRVIKIEDDTEVGGKKAERIRTQQPYMEVAIKLERATTNADGGDEGFILLEEATNGD